MTDHPCPFTAAELLVVLSTIDAHPSRAPGPARIAAKVKQHMDQHHPTTATKETSTDD